MSDVKTAGIGKGTPGPGRGKGTPNKVTADVKAMILEALNRAGGADYLLERAHDPKTASTFLTLLGKVLPTQVTGPNDGPLQIARIELVALDQSTDRSP